MLGMSEEINIDNLSAGGASNALIVLQMLQGLELKPNFVVLSFTNENRYEVDRNISSVPYDLEADSLAAYQKERYITNKNEIDPSQLEVINQMIVSASSPNFEKLKSYFYISFCLNTLKLKKIPFCFSLGGFEYEHNYTALINQNYLPNFIIDYKQNEIKTNLWYHGNKPSPYFHVDNDDIQQLFANECFKKIMQESTC